MPGTLFRLPKLFKHYKSLVSSPGLRSHSFRSSKGPNHMLEAVFEGKEPLLTTKRKEKMTSAYRSTVPKRTSTTASGRQCYGKFHWGSGSGDSAPKIAISLPKMASMSYGLGFPRRCDLAHAVSVEDANLEKSVFGLIRLSQ